MTRKDLLSVMALGAVAATAQGAAAHVYELRTYHCEAGRLPALLKRFREHTTKLFERHGMTNAGYWVPTDGEAHENTLVYLLRHDSREAAKKSWDAFRADAEWVKVRTESEADGKIVAKVESVYLDPTDFSKMG